MRNGFLILAEAGDEIGFGHYTRCSAIHNFLLSEGLDCFMLIDVKGSHELKLTNGRQLNWLQNKSEIENLIKKYPYVLVDSYLADQEYYQWLKSIAKELSVIDDYNRILYPADRLINPNVFYETMDYTKQNGTALYGGKEFVILRKVFRNANPNEIAEIVSKVVITIGGSDVRAILPELINIVKENLPNVRRCAIAGNADLKNKLASRFGNTEILDFLSAEEMLEAFQSADLIISACGQTLHELASMGKPTIGVLVGEDQKQNQEFYFDIGFLKEKIQYDNLNPIVDQLKALSGLNTRKELHNIGLNAINKFGVENICKLISR